MSSPITSSETISENSTLCSFDQCAAPFDVHCFHCDSKMCSQHYFEHKQEESIIKRDYAMDELLQLASSKWFCITKGGTSVIKNRRSFSNPFVSSTYLLKKMKQRVARRRNSKTPLVPTATPTYNLRKRRRKLVITTTASDCCGIINSKKPRSNKFCNHKLPCPYHTVE